MRIGIDLISIRRVERLLGSPEECALLFSNAELDAIQGDTTRASGYIALKEAYFKAVGKKGDWHTLEVGHEESGAPFLMIGNEKISSVSVSHDGEYATAVVLLL